MLVRFFVIMGTQLTTFFSDLQKTVYVNTHLDGYELIWFNDKYH